MHDKQNDFNCKVSIFMLKYNLSQHIEYISPNLYVSQGQIQRAVSGVATTHATSNQNHAHVNDKMSRNSDKQRQEEKG